jgi:hypothetical protein
MDSSYSEMDNKREIALLNKLGQEISFIKKKHINLAFRYSNGKYKPIVTLPTSMKYLHKSSNNKRLHRIPLCFIFLESDN